MAAPDGGSFRSYADVIDMDNRRKLVLIRAKNPPHGIVARIAHLLNIRGTLVPHVLSCPFFWISLALFTLIRIVSRLKPLPWSSWPQLTVNQISTLGGFVTFTLVFFVSQAYSRYVDLYRLETSFDGRVSEAILMIRSFMPEDRAWRLWRYMHAAHVLAYVGLSGGTVYGRATFFRALNDQYKLLTQDELERIDEINDFQTSGLATREIVAWIFEEIHDFFVTLPSDSPYIRCNNLWSDLNSQVLQMRGALGGLFGYSNMPIPFIYQHLVHSNTRIFLVLFSYAMAVTPPVAREDEITLAAVVIFMGFFVIGLRELGLELMDPFGTDLEDFTVLSFVTGSIENSRRLLLAKRRSNKSAETESELKSGRPGPGLPWESHKIANAFSPFELKKVNLEEPIEPKHFQPVFASKLMVINTEKMVDVVSVEEPVLVVEQ